jgi:hypothetical protein
MADSGETIRNWLLPVGLVLQAVRRQIKKDPAVMFKRRIG